VENTRGSQRTQHIALESFGDTTSTFAEEAAMRKAQLVRYLDFVWLLATAAVMVGASAMQNGLAQDAGHGERTGIELAGRADDEPPMQYWYVRDAKTKAADDLGDRRSCPPARSAASRDPSRASASFRSWSSSFLQNDILSGGDRRPTSRLSPWG